MPVDVMAGLAALGQAIGLVKDLHEIDKGFDTAEFPGNDGEIHLKHNPGAPYGTRTLRCASRPMRASTDPRLDSGGAIECLR
jgi:hypothetical protein